MVKSLKLFADCVTSMRTAEKAFEESPTPRNKSIMEDLQRKVDAWLEWIGKQQDAELAKNTPPFIQQRRSANSQGRNISNDMMKQLSARHTPEEIENFIKSINLNNGL